MGAKRQVIDQQACANQLDFSWHPDRSAVGWRRLSLRP